MTARTSPTQVGTATDWVTPNDGWTYMFALKTELWCSGRNDVAQLGLGDTAARTTMTRVCTP